MNQQRGRRFRSAKDAELAEAKARSKGETLPKEARFDSNCITPGTPFMCRLDNALRYFIQQKISTSKSWRNCKVILSGHETPGEGEHKIMEYIRYMKASEGYDPNTRHCLYGLDADLVMLGLCTHERHFSLLREEVKFGKKAAKAVGVAHQRFFLLHLSLMRDYLEQEFIVLKETMNVPFDIERIIDDWVLMVFLVGNDFIPNIPNLHINTNALPLLYNAYIQVMPKLDGYINEQGYLNLERLQTYMESFAEFDRDYFSSHYEDLKFLETKQKFDDRNDDTFGGNQALMDLVKETEFEFDSSPDDDDEFSNSDEDHDFEKEFYQHRRDYYVNKMKYDDMTPEVLAEQTKCYIEALQWTLSYYYHGVQSWNWFYPHHYAPFISDIRNFKNLKIKFEMSRPFLPFQQLMSVLPAGSRDHVPESYKELMISPYSPVIDFYPQNFDTDLNGKKQEWEAVVLIPFIEEKRLLDALAPLDKYLSPDEKARNVHGPMYVYTYSKKSHGQLEGPLNFPSIGNLMCEEKQVFRDEIQVPKNKLVHGPAAGSLKNVYYNGFPTFKHLQFKSELRRQAVQVFDQPSRDDNMIIKVENYSSDMRLEELGQRFLNKNVYVGWPHLMEARVVRITDEKHSFNGKMESTDPQRWRMETQQIRDHHHNRMGIDVGDISFIVHVQRVSGEEYKLHQESKIFKLIKTYDQQEICYPLQCIVTDITSYRKRYQEELPFTVAFKNGTEIFMLANPYYGSFGEVTDTSIFEKSGRLKIMLTVPQEPDFDEAQKLHDKCTGSYMSAYHAATMIGISDNALNRITGSVFVISGSKREISFQEASKVNIGLQMKFPKQNEELYGYTKKDTRFWLYSEKAVSVVQEYYCKYPVIFEILSKRTGQNTNYFESDFFSVTNGEQSISALTKFIAQLPHQKAPRVQIGSEYLDKEVVDMVKKEVANIKNAPMKKITMQVKPTLIYSPKLCQKTTKAPDTAANYDIFDRVVVAKESEKYSIGMKGTVVRISKVKDLNPVRQEWKNKEDTYCEILFDSTDEISRFHIDNLINITYGLNINPNKPVKENKKEVKIKPTEPKPPALTQSFASALKNQNDVSKNFAKVWNQLKSEPEKIGTSSVPVIVAPMCLPKPPEEWLKSPKKEEKSEEEIKNTEFNANAFFESFKKLGIQSNSNGPKNFAGNPNFPKPQQQPSHQGDMKFFKNNQNDQVSFFLMISQIRIRL
jgi:5'-3' exoribonuclease 1